ncbi:hypothetical protein [Treponema sp.]|uniref:hypothetical protein n=1 Tax=Treponema sp. TaxID=166 RepID=UPI003F0E5ECF
MLRQYYGSEGANYICQNDSSIQFACTVDAAAKGDAHAQAQLKYAFHEVGREMLGEISEKSGYASLACLAIGQPEGSAFFGGVSMVADGLLAVDDLLSGNYPEAAKNGIILLAGIVTPKVLKSGVNSFSKSIQITVGSTGRYYEVGHKGAIKTETALRKILAKDIADGYFGQEVIPNASFIIDEAVKIYKELTGSDND